MYLKNIEVYGFKSFANKIDFQFHNGITGIVGPNGSGKSNVGDAVRWVLGEQSAKSLRGSNMQDVIFSGTEMRKPMGYASVAITLDNSDHKLPVDYEEVTVTRRVYRSGESEYLINGTNCRLKDINELFYDTGIGKEGYSIIGQGQIDRILSGKPEDRRELFDEAAGIVKFKRRKAAAIKKLDDEQGNLARVNDILGELEKQVGPLERQSEKAKVFLKKREELKRLDINAFLLEVERLDGQLKATEEKYTQAKDEYQEATDSYEVTRGEYERMQGEIQQLDEQLEAKRNEIAEAQITRQKLEGQIAVLNEQINSANTSNEHHKNRQAAIDTDIAEKKAELKAVQKRKKQVDEQAAEAIEKRDDAKESIQAISDSIKHLSDSVEKNKQLILDALNARSDINSRMSKCDAAIEQLNIQKASLSSRLLRHKSEEADIKALIAQNEESFKKINSEIADLEAQIAAAELKSGELLELIRNKEKEHAEAERKYHEANTRLESLRNLMERYEGYGGSVRRIMEKKDKRVCGVVADIITVDKKYETAIETALGGNIQNIVTEDETAAKDMIAFLKENRLGRATFLPLTSVRERDFNAPDALKEKGVLGLADTLVKTDKKYTIVANNLLHNYIIVDTVDNALKLAKKFKYTLRIVTLQGEALNPGGSISGGSFKNNSNLLGRNREMEELEGKVKSAKEFSDAVFAEIEKTREERDELRKNIAVLREQQQDKFLLQNTAKVNLDQAKERVSESEKNFAELRSEESDIAMQAAQVESQKNQIKDELDTSQKSESDINKKIEEQTKLLEERQKKEADILAGMSDLEIEAARLVQKQEFEQGNVERIEADINRLLEERSQIDELLSNSRQDTENKLADIESIKETIKATETAQTEGEEFLKETLERKEAIAQQQKEFLSKREALSDRKTNLDKEVYRLSSQVDKLKEDTEGKYAYMWAEYEITMSQAKEQRDESLTDLSAMKKEITALKTSIRELGPVNVNAIEDYLNLMERYEFMRTQRDDLVAAKESLEKVIEELDEGMRRQFTEKFAEIAVQFNKVFKEMFGGGKGTLELLEEEDILEAGIKIIAQPPGKKLQNMMQLSGGEKALTAIALLFAIQNLKPSPFCLLDEIEAALDESNVGRFAGYLKKLTKHTQFIVITHRRGTMEKADRLYGITMQEKGVSALVSVNLIDDKDLE